MRLNKLQKIAVAALEEIKAQDIQVLDVRKMTSMCDSMIIASAQSTRQVKAIAINVRDRLKEAGASIIGTEGEEASEWVLVDCGDIIVHVMQPAVREHYKLEELWTAPLVKRVRASRSAGDAGAGSTPSSESASKTRASV
jgi:ribosome-associated protein